MFAFFELKFKRNSQNHKTWMMSIVAFKKNKKMAKTGHLDS